MRRTQIAALAMAMTVLTTLTLSQSVLAMDFYNLKAKSVHCANSAPIESGDFYPLGEKGCAIVGTDWGLLDDPLEIKPGVVKIEMGGVFGIRYARSSDVYKE